MRFKEKCSLLYGEMDKRFFQQFGFYINVMSLSKFTDYLYTRKDSSSLAVTRILFGLAMLFDIPDERGGATMDKRWGNYKTCHFPLFPFVRAAPLPYMAAVYAAMWFGALGIMLGYKYRISASLFTACHWYLLLVDKSFWNNHSYLFGLIALLLSCTEANCYWSVDAYLNSSTMKLTVPYWNYFILKYQFFVLYFFAGLKKGTAEWLTGYSVVNLSEHWVFDPFKIFMSVGQTDYLIVHWFAFVFDLTVAVWMIWSRTRHVAMIFCALFHLMNSRLFRIGMFPWVCLATMPLFYPFDWPKLVINFTREYYVKIKLEMCSSMRVSKAKALWFLKPAELENMKEKDKNKNEPEELNVNEKDDVIDSDKSTKQTNSDNNSKGENIVDGNTKESTDVSDGEIEQSTICEDIGIHDESQTVSDVSFKFDFDDKHKKRTSYMIIIYILTQAFLPYSHFITKGYNNWTNGLYGYSWDMMVHSWDAHSVVVKVVDNDRNQTFFVDPYIYTLNDRWTRHGDMIYQYARCLKNNLINESRDRRQFSEPMLISENLSIYIDVWYSMNGRFIQRMFDSKTDILKASWSPFEDIPYLMPLLDEALNWRIVLDELREHVHSWNNYSDVIFLAEFPDYYVEKYIPLELQNVTLTVLEGLLVYEPEVTTHKQIGKSYQLIAGDRITVDIGNFHKVLNIGDKPVYFMYTFVNTTEQERYYYKEEDQMKQKLPVGKELLKRFINMFVFANLVVTNIVMLFFRLSMLLKLT